VLAFARNACRLSMPPGITARQVYDMARASEPGAGA
jgi:hypothetical protein